MKLYNLLQCENLVDKLFTICKWDASCLYRISYEHLLVVLFKLFWLERSSIGPSGVDHFLIFTQGAQIKKCRLKVEVAMLSINDAMQVWLFFTPSPFVTLITCFTWAFIHSVTKLWLFVHPPYFMNAPSQSDHGWV